LERKKAVVTWLIFFKYEAYYSISATTNCHYQYLLIKKAYEKIFNDLLPSQVVSKITFFTLHDIFISLN